ncbi:hypothetical protein FPANT_4312 [Fusarium pseudoanthophilum]|uniref:Uncharacterized protein n=1 Tax=Fusarium pseudoanthophilum TaxID=48495 RepID=A0A8H5PHC3_9HYPO|nr:hypothetical protein FPANT_4312 [Fusarium pseudoanthophilum]
MPHPRIPGYAALKRADQGAKQEARPETQSKGVTFVESLALRSVTTEKTPGLRLVNNSPGGGRQENVVAKVPGVEGTYAAVIDNAESLMEVFRMMPRGKLSIIVAVPPNGSGASLTSTEIPWSALKAGEDEAAATPDTPENESSDDQAPGDDETVFGDDETVVGEDHSPKKGAREEDTETPPQPTTTAAAPATEQEVPYPDLLGHERGVCTLAHEGL